MENKFIRVDEVAKELDVSTSYAYKLIRQLNNELKAKGFDKSNKTRRCGGERNTNQTTVF